VVLEGVSVTNVSGTSKTRSTVTVATQTWYTKPCPAGYLCATIVYTSTEYLTVTWSGKARPTVGSVINLFGTTTLGSLNPDGYTPNYAGCYIDWC
jgi:hypothetical protein